jgi:PIN domain nuclease of toxin-antitoxin system
MIRSILLDTCAAIWIAHGDELSQGAVDAIAEVEAAGGVVALSVITAWEVGLLVSRGRLALSRDPAGWFDDLVNLGYQLAPLAPSILIASSFLPASDLRDPADCILAATARALNFRLMTRDQRLLDYAAAGHLAAIPC